MSNETLAFTVSPTIIRHLIERQAGTVEKAVLELIMNGIDAGASRIDVDFDGNAALTVKDNGRGFQSRAEIEKHFQTFGFDHNTEEEQAYQRQSGQFGLGRSQIYGFGRTVWTTHQFRMEVDIGQDRDLVFDYGEVEGQAVDGCQIDVALYRPLSEVDKERVRRTLSDYVQYAPADIRIDGERVNKPLNDVKWTAETDRLYFLHKPTAESGIEVHNLGIFVNRFAYHTMGVSGVIVSKANHSFKVTMSRTDVHRTCELWAEMQKLIKPYKEKQRRKKRLTDADRMGIVQDWMHGELEDGKVKTTARLFKTVKGNYLTLHQLRNYANGVVCIHEGRGDRVAEAIHARHSAAVLATDIRDWMDLGEDEEVVKALNRFAANGYLQPAFSLGNYKAMSQGYDNRLINVEREQWTKTEVAQMAAVKAAYSGIVHGVNGGQGYVERTRDRVLLLGDAETAEAWTDGGNYICIDRRFLAECFQCGMDGLSRLVSVLVHEQLHHEPDTGTDHDHPPEFFEAFENVLTSRALSVYSISAKMIKRYDNERAKVGLRRSIKMARMMDQVQETQTDECVAIA